MPALCQITGCQKHSSYGSPGTKIAVFCAEHKQADYVDVINKRCSAPGCNKRPTYGAPGTKIAVFCVEHKQADHINVIGKRCNALGCNKQPTYGAPGTKIAVFCAEHKQADHVDVIHNHCSAPGCNKRPTYGAPGTKIAVFCLEHKQADHVDVISNHCSAPGCNKRPTYGAPETKIAIFCLEHKQADHIDIISRRCTIPGCNKQPAYGAPGTKIAVFCLEHKQADHVDVKHNHCSVPGCNKIPSYGMSGTKIAVFCLEHKQADHIDVRNNHCSAPDCNRRAYYGIPGNQAESCPDHIEKGMIRSPMKRCSECNELGIWGRNNVDPKRRCDAHRLPTDRNLIEGRCASCGLEGILDKLSVCQICGEAGKIKRRFLEKQTRTKEVIAKEFQIESYDKILDVGVCSRRRPDIVINGVYRKVVIEIDEFQHRRSRDYSPDCEIRRMWDIAQALGMPTVFIRYNPDAYVDAKGVRCDPVLSEREKALISWTRTLKDRLPPEGKFATAIYLFYDGHTTSEACAEEPLPDPFEAFALNDDQLDLILSDLIDPPVDQDVAEFIEQIAAMML